MDALESLNNVMNNIDNWTQSSQGCLSRHVKTRVATFFIAAPLEFMILAKYAIAAPFQASGAIIKLGLKPISYISKSSLLKTMDQKLPSIKDFLKAILRISKLAIGTLFSTFIGLISPFLNFHIHVALDIIKDEKQELYRSILLETELRKLAKEFKHLQNQIVKVMNEKKINQPFDPVIVKLLTRMVSNEKPHSSLIAGTT